jgi:hypothetical protein
MRTPASLLAISAVTTSMTVFAACGGGAENDHVELAVQSLRKSTLAEDMAPLINAQGFSQACPLPSAVGRVPPPTTAPLEGFATAGRLANPPPTWSPQLLDSGDPDTAHAVAADSGICAIFEGGETNWIIDPSMHPDYEPYAADAYVARYSTTGALVWVHQFSDYFHEDVVLDIAVDSHHNVYATGFTTGTFSDSPTWNQGREDVFLFKLDQDGNEIWVRQLGTRAEDKAYGIAINDNDEIYLAGATYGDFATNSTDTLVPDFFLAKYDSDGNLLMVMDSGTPSVDYAMDVAVGPLGNVYIAGATVGVYPEEDLFVAKYDPNGNELWFSQRGSTTMDVANGVVVNDDGQVFVTGKTLGSVDGNVHRGGSDIVLLQFDATDGDWGWTAQRGSAADDVATGIALTADGGPMVTGWSEGSLDGHSNFGGADLFVMKHSPAGTWRWTRHYGVDTAESYYANAIAVGPGDESYIAGEIQIAVLGDSSDALAVKFDRDGYRR